MIRQRIEEALKTALLAGDAETVSVLRALKSAILYAEVAKSLPRGTLPEADILEVLAKEAKKRQESAEAFKTASRQDKAEAELKEKQLIDTYLPKPLPKEEIEELIDEAIAEVGELTPQTLGRVIGSVKQRAGASANGALIAQLVKERVNK